MYFKSFETNGKEILAVRVPSQVKIEECFCDETCLYLGDLPNNISSHFVRIPNGTWKIIGLASEIVKDEAKCADLVEQYGELSYRDYNSKDNGFGKSAFNTAIESFHSLQQREKLFVTNPYGETKPEINDRDVSSQYYGSEMDYQLKWIEAQQHVGEYLLVREVK